VKPNERLVKCIWISFNRAEVNCWQVHLSGVKVLATASLSLLEAILIIWHLLLLCLFLLSHFSIRCLFCIIVPTLVCSVCFFIILYSMYTDCNISVFLLLYMFHSGYSVSFCSSLYCLCVNVYCTTANGCQPNCS